MDKEREAFDKWYREKPKGWLDGVKYNTAWKAWQAAKAQADQKVKLLLCDEHLKKCESPTGIFNSQYPDEEPCLICLAKEAKAQAVHEQVLDAPACVGAGTFQKGVKWSTVIAAAQRHFKYTQNAKKAPSLDIDQVKKLVSGDFVLVPKELSDELADELASDAFNNIQSMFDYEHRGSTATHREQIRLRWCKNKAREFQENYKIVIEAQEPAND
ncbi:hypothetical protein [Acinetobacter sp. ANC 5414]|uniref:hypothetical protein n=1 Tax=Acinetobacter sp. ANC 5414 TaxID=2731251 RepID=UPI0014905F22|nr:hypothetical protein [Acinetobacter sp. ANC 5414]NNH00253.1 hypothetical protein [Acinetobacter sp. ANC 5414]